VFEHPKTKTTSLFVSIPAVVTHAPFRPLNVFVVFETFVFGRAKLVCFLPLTLDAGDKEFMVPEE
jgi:hypothetical protein